jgi:UDP-N-acetylmuramoyl-L-alanyl-D-glutamate--2,6-diaminopimelate ligase
MKKSFTTSTLELTPGMEFIAIVGHKVDGHDLIARAIELGAKKITLNESHFSRYEHLLKNIPYHCVPDTRLYYAKKSAEFFGNLSENQKGENLKIIGITGTNGKTTTAWITYSLLNLYFAKRGFSSKCALIGTLGVYLNGEKIESTLHTTPDAFQLHQLLADIKKRGGTHVVMEVSSHALVQGRVSAVQFAATAFTNLTQDHLDYHQTMEAYFQAKKLLFLLNTPVKVINPSNPYGERLLAEIKGSIPCQIRYFKDSPFVGEYNKENLSLAVGILSALDFPTKSIIESIHQLTQVPGRLERLDTSRGAIYIDYAHTPDALKRVLETLRQDDKTRNLTVLFGCGGDRDRSKRPLMGEIASIADEIIVTSDNPRSERPIDVIADIMQGIPLYRDKIYIVSDRREAIALGVLLHFRKELGDGNILLLAGKGHEDYQEINGKRFPFNEKEILQSLL